MLPTLKTFRFRPPTSDLRSQTSDISIQSVFLSLQNESRHFNIQQ